MSLLISAKYMDINVNNQIKIELYKKKGSGAKTLKYLQVISQAWIY
jgi:hypothetical protein